MCYSNTTASAGQCLPVSSCTGSGFGIFPCSSFLVCDCYKSRVKLSNSPSRVKYSFKRTISHLAPRYLIHTPIYTWTWAHFWHIQGLLFWEGKQTGEVCLQIQGSSECEWALILDEWHEQQPRHGKKQVTVNGYASPKRWAMSPVTSGLPCTKAQTGPVSSTTHTGDLRQTLMPSWRGMERISRGSARTPRASIPTPMISSFSISRQGDSWQGTCSPGQLPSLAPE